MARHLVPPGRAQNATECYFVLSTWSRSAAFACTERSSASGAACRNARYAAVASSLPSRRTSARYRPVARRSRARRASGISARLVECLGEALPAIENRSYVDVRVVPGKEELVRARRAQGGEEFARRDGVIAHQHSPLGPRLQARREYTREHPADRPAVVAARCAVAGDAVGERATD